MRKPRRFTGGIQTPTGADGDASKRNRKGAHLRQCEKKQRQQLIQREELGE